MESLSKFDIAARLNKLAKMSMDADRAINALFGCTGDDFHHRFNAVKALEADFYAFSKAAKTLADEIQAEADMEDF